MAAGQVASILMGLFRQMGRQSAVLGGSREALQRAQINLTRLQAEMIRAPTAVTGAQAALGAAQSQYQAAPTQANLDAIREARAALLDAKAHLQEVRANFANANQQMAISRQQFTLSQQGLSGLTAQTRPQIAAAGFQSLGQALQPNASFGQTMAGVGGAMTAGGLMAGGVLGGAAVGVGAFLVALGVATDKLKEWSDKLLEGSFKFAEFSGSMAMVQAEMQIQQIMLAQERGERRAESTRRLANARMELERSTAPFEDFWENLKAELIAPLMQGLAELIKGIKGILNWLGIMKDEQDDRNNMRAMDEFMRAIGQGQWINQFGRPGRFGPGPDAGGDFQASGGDF